VLGLLGLFNETPLANLSWELMRTPFDNALVQPERDCFSLLPNFLTTMN